MQGILLIGMPGVGKSAIGKKVAEMLGFSFYDGDAEIEKKHSDRQDFLDRKGDEAYVEMECSIIAGLPREDSVLSPGGSIIYSKECMKSLGCCFKVFLDASLDTVRKRLINVDSRGIVFLRKLGMEALHRQRRVLCLKYADIIIDTESRTEEELAKEIVAAYSVRQLSGKNPP